MSNSTAYTTLAIRGTAAQAQPTPPTTTSLLTQLMAKDQKIAGLNASVTGMAVTIAFIALFAILALVGWLIHRRQIARHRTRNAAFTAAQYRARSQQAQPGRSLSGSTKASTYAYGRDAALAEEEAGTGDLGDGSSRPHRESWE